MTTGKVFQSKHGQAIRLPKHIRVNGSELLIFRRGDEIILCEKKGTMLRAFDLLASLPNEPTHFPKRLNKHRLKR
jgi:antitoxin VapB